MAMKTKPHEKRLGMRTPEAVAKELAALQRAVSGRSVAKVTHVPPKAAPAPVKPSPAKAAVAEAEDDADRVKVTYRFSSEAVDAVEDIRSMLRRKFGVRRVNREDIAEAAILETLRSLEAAGDRSWVVKKFRQG